MNDLFDSPDSMLTETILPKKLSQKEKRLLVAVWVMSLLLAAVLTFLGCSLLTLGFLPAVIAFLLIAVDLYAAWRLSARFSMEVEYSLTNVFFDADRIIARSDRVSLASLSLTAVTQLGRYRADGSLPHTLRTVHAEADAQSDALWYLVYEDEAGKSVLLIFEPDEKILHHMSRFVPRSVAKMMLDPYRHD